MAKKFYLLNSFGELQKVPHIFPFKYQHQVLSPFEDEESKERKFKQFPSCSSYVLTNKWNGTNVTFYKYKSNDGTLLPTILFSLTSSGDWYISVKPRMTPFLSDGPTGNFLTVVYKFLKLPVTFPLTNKLPALLHNLVRLLNYR